MTVIEPGEKSTHFDFETFAFHKSLIPVLIGHPQQWTWNDFHYDSDGDHLQTFKTQSTVSQVHDWLVVSWG
jgi:hypothetical protein